MSRGKKKPANYAITDLRGSVLIGCDGEYNIMFQIDGTQYSFTVGPKILEEMTWAFDKTPPVVMQLLSYKGIKAVEDE